MNKENYKNEVLGEYYLSHEQLRDKKLIISTINKFINQSKGLRPDGMATSQKLKLHNYAKNNDYQILDDYYFVRNFGEFMCSYSGYEIGILYNPTIDENRIYLQRSHGQISELSTRLGIQTLVDLYHIIITDVVSYSYLARERKENLNKAIELLTSDKWNIEYFNNGSDFKLFKFKQIEIKDINIPNIIYGEDCYNINQDSLFNDLLLNNSFRYGIHSHKDITRLVGRNIRTIENNEEVKSIIYELYEKKRTELNDKIMKSEKTLDKLLKNIV